MGKVEIKCRKTFPNTVAISVPFNYKYSAILKKYQKYLQFYHKRQKKPKGCFLQLQVKNQNFISKL